MNKKLILTISMLFLITLFLSGCKIENFEIVNPPDGYDYKDYSIVKVKIDKLLINEGEVESEVYFTINYNNKYYRRIPKNDSKIFPGIEKGKIYSLGYNSYYDKNKVEPILIQNNFKDYKQYRLIIKMWDRDNLSEPDLLNSKIIILRNCKNEYSGWTSGKYGQFKYRVDIEGCE